jgi:hypothetical protein
VARRRGAGRPAAARKPIGVAKVLLHGSDELFSAKKKIKRDQLKNSDAGKTCSYGYITFKVRGYTYISAKLDYMSSQEDKKIQFYHSAQI